MSYILDALRRAEAERERGNVPGLHTQPVAAPTAPATPARLQPALLWSSGLGLALLAAALAWWLLARPPVHEPVAVAVVAAPRPAPAPTPAVPVAPEAIAPSEAVKVVPVTPAPPPPRAAAASVPMMPSAPASVANPAPAIVPWDRLPDGQRRQLPVLAISGAIWSESAANRMLIVSGQLLHEGDTAAPGVVLEQIRPKSAVLRWKDLRYEVSF